MSGGNKRGGYRETEGRVKKESMSGIIGVSGASSFSDVSLCKHCLPLQGVACMSFNAAAFAVSIFRLLSKLTIVLNCPQNVLLSVM